MSEQVQVPDFAPTGGSVRQTAAIIAALALLTDDRRRRARRLLDRIGYPPEGDPDEARQNRWILLLILLVATTLARWARQMAAGEIPIGQWQTQSAELIADAYVAALVIGRGGWDRVTRDDEAWAEAETRFALGRLERFARTVEAGTSVTTTADAAAARAALYGRYATVIFEQARRASALERGLRLERNVLGVAEHCAECLELTSRGWVPIGTLPPPGKRRCKSNCKCRFTYS